MHSLSRRKFLAGASLGAASTLLAACAPKVVEVEKVVKETVVTEKVVKETVIVEGTPQVVEKVVTSVVEKVVKTEYEGNFVVLSCAPMEREIPMIEEIQAKYPGLTVDWRNLTSEKFTELFAASEVAGDQIDVMDLNGQDLRRYAVAGKLIDLSDISYLDRFRPVGIDTYTLKGKLWALPRGDIAGWSLLYNKKAFEAIGVTDEISTYAELQEMAPELKKAGYEVISHEGKVLYMWPVWHFILHAQTSMNQSIENTVQTLVGEKKFNDPEYVEALDWLRRYSEDGMFNEAVLSTDRDGAMLMLKQGKVAMYHNWPGVIGDYRENDYPELDMSIMPPLQVVEGAKRQLPGGTGRALCIYKGIAKERLSLAYDMIDIMTSDKWVEQMNIEGNASVSCNVNVQPSDDPLALKYADECAPLQVVYEDWVWPPEITRGFQEGEQAVVAGTKTPQEVADANQKILEDLYDEGYEFVN